MNLEAHGSDELDPMSRHLVSRRLGIPDEGVRYGDSPVTPKGVPTVAGQTVIPEGHIANGGWEVKPFNPDLRGTRTDVSDRPTTPEV